MSCFGTKQFNYSPGGWSVQYYPDIDWHRISLLPQARLFTEKQDLYGLKRERNIKAVWFDSKSEPKTTETPNARGGNR